jgi:putative cell wall-binding protein
MTALLLAAALVAGLLTGVLPVRDAAAQISAGSGGVAIDLAGLDEVAAGVASPVTATVRITERGTLRDTTPLRLVGTIDGAVTEVAHRRADGSVDVLPVGDDGTFVYPRLDRAPLTIGSNPDLLSEGGLVTTLLLTLPDAEETGLSVGLAVSNERAAGVTRLSGRERIETAAAISARTFNPGVAIAYISRADDFPDALAGGPNAGLGGNPILLSTTEALPEATRTELIRLQPGRIVVLGGDAAISDSVIAELAELTDGSVRRLSGTNRFGTAAAVALDRYTGPVETVVVATGAAFADALAGGPAAALLDAPILLVNPDSIPEATAEALTALRPGRIVVLGGDAAIDDATVAALGAFTDGDVDRLFGPTRFETAAAVSEATFEPGAVNTVYLATGEKFPDSLAGTPAAVIDGAPLLLVTADGIPGAVADEIRRLGPAIVVILGGTGVVGEAVADAVTALTREIAPDPARFTAVGTPATATFTPIPPSPCDTDTRFASSASLGSTAVRGDLTSARDGGFATASAGEPLGAPGRTAAGPSAAAIDDAVTITAPTTAAPTLLRLRGRFSLTFTSPAGDYAIDFRAGDGAWQPFPNLDAAGSTAGGERTIRLNAPIDAGVYDVRVTVTTASGPAAAIQDDALDVQVFIPGTPPPQGPPPILTPLVEGLADQPQVFSVPPAGGLRYAEDGSTRLKVLLSFAERSHVDYPLDAEVEVLNGKGTAELIVSRDEFAEIIYTMHPDDQPVGDDGSPVAPFTRYTFRIDGVDVADVDQSVIGGFFRTDDQHGVNIVFPIGEGASVSSPEVSGLRGGKPFGFQFLSFGIHPALPAGESVTIDLSEAVAAGVDYSDAFAFLGGGGHGHDAPELPATVAFSDDGRQLVFTATEGGYPSIQPPAEQPIPTIFIDGVDTTAAEGGIVTVPFARSDRPSANPGIATFEVLPTIGLTEVSASDLACGQADQTQTLSFTLDGDARDGEPVFVGLGGAQRGGADYTSATVTVAEGSGSAELFVDQFEGEDEVFLELFYFPTSDDLDGDTIVLEVDGVDTDEVNESHLATFFRDGSFTSSTAVFDIGAGSAFVSPRIADLEANRTDNFQFIDFALREDLGAGESVTIDLSSAEQGGASYGGASVFAFSHDSGAPAEVALEVVDGTSAVVTYTAGDDGLAAGSPIFAKVAGVVTGSVEEEHVALLRRADGTGEAQVGFAIRRFPALSEATVGNLAAGAAGQDQIITARVVEDLPGGTGVEIDLSAAHNGGADYSGATATVLSGNGTAQVEVFDGGPPHGPHPAHGGGGAFVLFNTNRSGIPDGGEIRIRLSNVAADDVDETHVVWLYRFDGGRGTQATFDIGEGGVFVGSPYANDVFQAGGPDDIRQYFFFTPARALAAGETVTIDLSSAQQGAVDYTGGVTELFAGRGSVALEVTESSAVLTYTAPAGGLAAGEGVGAHIHELLAVETPDVYEAVFTVEGRSASAPFRVSLGGHGGGPGEPVPGASPAAQTFRTDGTRVR